jgi:hypothetical protein
MSTNDKRPEGQRYTLVYLEKGPPEKDSLNFRARLIAFLSKTYSKFYFELQRGLRLELGARVPNSDNGYYDLLDFFEKGELNAVLDAITIVYRVLSGNAYTNAQNWIEFCNRAFSEENIAWKVDARGGVHPLIDAEFQRSTAAAIAGLDDARLVSVRELIETCTKRLDERPPATRDAIGNVYAAVESLF